MKKQKITLIITLAAFLLMIGANVYAGCTADRCYGQIERLVMSGSALYIGTDGDETNLDCTPLSGVYLTLSTTEESFNKQYAMMLTAMSTDKAVGFRIINGSQGCRVSYTYYDK